MFGDYSSGFWIAFLLVLITRTDLLDFFLLVMMDPKEVAIPFLIFVLLEALATIRPLAFARLSHLRAVSKRGW